MKEKKRPEISVIMGVYNQWDSGRLQESITSVLEQTFRDFEFIIYSDGSDAAVLEQLEQYARQDERIVLIHNPLNHGLAYSLNMCIDVAGGKYLARMDDDDVCVPERFAVQYEFMEAHPEISFSGSNAKLLDDRGVWGIRRMPEWPDKRDFLKYSPFIHPSLFVRRSVFETEGDYRAGKETWRCEDYELFMRLWKSGCRGCNLQKELLYYREDRNAYRKRKWKHRMNEMRLRYRNFREMKLLFPFGWCYVLRPVVAGIVPSGLIFGAKRLYHLREKAFVRRRACGKNIGRKEFAEETDEK
ncbi:MAG: glycosyltransferase [Lachnospiraceae bacterium]|nr:glycosyltransferase [Lachnospiraceae bacterium]